MTDPEWQDDPYREKSLYDVYKASAVIEPSEFNRRCMRVCYVICTLYVAVNAYTGINNADIIAAINRLSGSLINVTTSILGFLIAGFSIFVSSTRNENFYLLLKTRYNTTSISYFKHIMFNFLNVFTVYLLVLAASLAINTSVPLGWSPLIRWEPPTRLITTFNSAVLGATVIGALYATLRLKSFIWTMYQGLLVNMALEKEFGQDSAKKR